MEFANTTDAELPIGEVLGGRYRLERLAGRGGMSRVYAAIDQASGRAVAVKVLRADFAEGSRRERFVREIRLLEGFTHPHILPILDAGDAGGRLYYVMPLVPGMSLGDRLATESQLSVEDTVRLLLPVCDALAAAHARGIVHRDVKPDNILTSPDGTWLADFGVARAVASVGGDSLTQSGIAVGTPMYMSPEQASGLETLDGRSDQYAVACVAYECLAGLPPFRGATPQVVARQRLMGPPQDIRLLRPEVSDAMAAVLTMALSVTPADRFPTIQAFAKALERAASAPRSATTASLQLPPVVVPRSFVQRRPVVAGGLAVAAVGAIASVAVFAVRGSARDVDPARVAVTPVAAGAGLDDAGRAAVLGASRAALATWRGLSVVAVPDSGGRAAARDSGAARLVSAAVARLGDSVTIRVLVTRVATNQRDGEAVATRAAADRGLPAVLGDLTEAAMAQALFGSTAARAAAPRVRHVGALEAFDRGHLALARWDLASARDAFVEARRADSTFAAADLWLAQLEVWQAPSRAPSPDATERLRLAARRAVRDSARLTARERTLAQGLLALGEGRFPASCEAFDRLASADSLDAEALFGAGECRRRDNVVQLRAGGPVFRASYHRAIRAYAAALRADPLVARTFGGTALWRLPAVLMADAATVRGGADSAGERYAAVPSWRGDTMAFVPVPMAAFMRGEIGGAFAWTALARERANAVLADIARGWVRAAPGDADAHEVLAWSLESAGLLADGGSGPSAEGELRAASAATHDDARRIRVGVSQVRVLIKRAAWTEARALSDSLLRGYREATGDDAELLAPLAVLVGEPNEAVRLLTRAGPRLMAGRPDREREAFVRALAFLSVGEPRDSALLWAARSSALVTMPAALSTLCIAAQTAFATVGATALHGQGSCAGMPHLAAQRLLSSGDRAQAQRLLEGIVARGRSVSGFTVTPDAAAAEVHLLAALEGQAVARRHADDALDRLDRQSATLLSQPMLAGGVVALLRHRAGLGGERGQLANTATLALKGARVVERQ